MNHLKRRYGSKVTARRRIAICYAPEKKKQTGLLLTGWAGRVFQESTPSLREDEHLSVCLHLTSQWGRARPGRACRRLQRAMLAASGLSPSSRRGDAGRARCGARIGCRQPLELAAAAAHRFTKPAGDADGLVEPRRHKGGGREGRESASATPRRSGAGSSPPANENGAEAMVHHFVNRFV